MMKVGFVGCGEMGAPMAGHVVKSGKFEVVVFDVRPAATKAIARKGARVAKSLEDLGRFCDVFIVMVGYDQQVKQVVTDLALVGKKGAVIVITATSHPDMILECGVICRRRGMGVVDAPVCFGLGGARDGTLASLVGGSKKDVEKARPVLECYSRAVHHLGELGAGEIGKTDQKAESAARIRSEVERVRNRRGGRRELKSRRRELRLTPSADDLITCANGGVRADRRRPGI